MEQEDDFQDTTNMAGGKKARRNNKKNKQAQAAAAEEDEQAELEAVEKRKQAESAMLASGTADADDSDEDDPIFGKKGKKNQKKGGKKGGQQQDDKRQRQGKKGKKGQAAAEEEDETEETKEATADDEEEKKEPVVDEEVSAPVSYPLDVLYCGKCGLPPEYCEWAGRGQDIDECKKWLADSHPEHFEKLYVVAEGEEESKEAGGKKQKKKKKVGFASDQDKKIRVIKLKRGGKKTCSSIIGLNSYGCDLAQVAKIFSRKLGTGAAAMEIEYKELKEMGVQVQGDVSDRMEEIVTTDLAQYNIPIDKIIYEDGGNKKNRTMGVGRGPQPSSAPRGGAPAQ